MLVVVFIGFSQTLTFREYAREMILNELNTSFKGHVNIERIDGTVLTSIFLRNVTLTNEADTVISARNIEVKTSPLQLLLKRIYIRKLKLEDVDINFRQYPDSTWNINQALESTTPPKTVEDENDSKFPFDLVINNFEIKNLSFRNKAIGYADDDNSYDVLNTDDLLITKMNFLADLNINPASNKYSAYIYQIAAKTNFGNFELLESSGIFELSQESARIEDFYLLTNRSEISLSAELDNVNIFESADIETFKNSPLSMELYTNPFDFDDLTSFIGSTDMLKSAINVDFKTEGMFGDFNINNFQVSFGNTNLNLTGNVKNLDTPSNLQVDAAIEKSNLSYKDARNLLKPLDLPEFENLTMRETSLYFKGEPTKFYATLFTNIGNGKLNLDCFLNTQGDELEYDVSLESERINLSPIIKMKTNLNSYISVQGSGLSPDNWDADILCEIKNSEFDNYSLDSLTLRAGANKLNADISLSSLINNAKASLLGKINYNPQLVPAYDLKGRIENFNLMEFHPDSTLNSDFNFDFDLQGEYVDLDSVTGHFIIDMQNSFLNSRPISDARLELELNKSDEERTINLTSDFADFNIFGNYSLSDAVELIGYETSTIADIIRYKSTDLNPFETETTDSMIILNNSRFPNVINKDIEFDYKINFKDLSLVALFMNIDELDISGHGEGKVKNDSLNFSISSGLYLDYLLFKENDSFYLTDFEADINFSRNNRTLLFDDIFGTLSLSGKELYSGTKFSNLYADVTFNQKKLYFNLSTDISEKINSEVDGYLLMSDSSQTLNINRLAVNYKDLMWNNDSLLTIAFTQDKIDLNEIRLTNGEAVINLQGNIFRNGDLAVDLTGANIPGKIISRYIFDSNDNRIKADINFNASISGTTNEPIISSELNAADIMYENTPVGSVNCIVDYSNGVFTPHLELLNNKNQKKLLASGKLPVYVGFGDPTIYDSNEEIDISIKTDSLNVSQFGNAIPNIVNQKGFIDADINVKGAFDDLHYSGFITIPSLQFRSLDNELDYLTKITATFDDERIDVSEFSLRNNGGSTYSGTINGNGEVILNGFHLDRIDISANGDLAVLSRNARGITPYIYGDLFVGTNGDLKFTYRDGSSKLNGSLLLKEVDLTYVLGSSASTSNNDNFIYKILVDSSKLDLTQLKISQFVSNIRNEENRKLKEANEFPFDFNLYMKAENEAKLEFIISKAANQKLVVYATGDLDFRTLNGIPNAQGEFTLQPGSKLEFFTTFQADGSIRFDSDITNPYLNIVATYLTSLQLGEDPTTEDVAVKLNLKGQVTDLGKNLASNPDNIGIYVGRRNIDNNVKDQRYDVSDAFSLIIMGNLKENLSGTELQGVKKGLNNTTNSVISSVLTSLVNSAIGDYVSDIQISNSDARNLTVSGKIQNIRYKIGASTEQINKTNLRIEYLLNPNFLIRLERKDPVVGTFADQELINELGLKYRFEF